MKNMNKVRDMKKARRVWIVVCKSKGALEVLKRLYKDIALEEIELVKPGDEFAGYWRLLFRSTVSRRNEIVELLELEWDKSVSNKRRWILHVDKDGYIVKEEEIKEPDTFIYDRQGWSHEGYLCGKHCIGCPYIVEDCTGKDACYASTYKQCELNQ